MKYESEVITELCCELCSEPIHNHFACPGCGNGFASTDIYGGFFEFFEDYATDIFECEECNTKWRLLNKDNFPMIEIEEVK